MCSFATGAGSRVMTSTFGCARVRVVTLEKKLIFCSSCTGFGFHTFSLQGFRPGVTQVGCVETAQCPIRDPAAWAWPGLNRDTSDARARTSFVILLERRVIEMGTPVLRL